jgi:threonine dehydrogenase-like Zn-dependent dehydrogenase
MCALRSEGRLLIDDDARGASCLPSNTTWPWSSTVSEVQAAVLESVGNLVIRDLPEPSVLPGELLLEVLACGVCGSDMSMISAGFPVGAVLGHEVVGRVLAGASSGSPEEEEIVVVRPNAWCGSCSWCVAGRHQLCPDAISHGLGIGRQGGFAERLAVPANLCRSVSGVDVLDAVFADPLAVALHAVARAGSKGASFAVLGLGPTGLAVLRAGLLMGMGPAVGVDRHPPKQRHALDLGARAVTDPGDVAGLHEALEGAPAVVFECSGRPAAVAHALNAASLGGVVVLVGVSLHDAAIAPSVALTKELDIRASYCYSNDDWDQAIAMLKDRRVRLSAVVDGPVALEELPAGLTRLAGGEVTKVVVTSGDRSPP